MSDLLGAVVLFGLTLLPSLVVNGYRRLRNLDRLDAAQRSQRVALQMASQAQAQAVAGQEQLAACRAVLAVTMRERDHYQTAVDALARKVATLEQQRRRERLLSRYWLTRTIHRRKVSEN